MKSPEYVGNSNEGFSDREGHWLYGIADGDAVFNARIADARRKASVRRCFEARELARGVGLLVDAGDDSQQIRRSSYDNPESEFPGRALGYVADVVWFPGAESLAHRPSHCG